MAVRTVRLDVQVRAAAAKTPYDVYRDIAPADGGWALAPAREAKHRLRDTITRKHSPVTSRATISVPISSVAATAISHSN